MATHQRAGIGAKMITGNHRVTALTIARQVGLCDNERVLSGQELLAMDDRELEPLVEDVDVYDNLRKAILLILPTNGGEAMIILLAILLGATQFPLTPVQILWVNMITAATLALALAFEPPEQGIMHRPRRDAREPLLTRLFLWRILFVSLILVAGTFGLFAWDLSRDLGIAHARTVAVNTLVASSVLWLVEIEKAAVRHHRHRTS